MIDNYRGLAVFVAVIDAGSFTGAARFLKLSTSVISHHISRLEERLGTPLLFRSTRSLTLTSEGERVLVAARQMVAAGQDALDTLAETSDQPVGNLRISLPAFGARGPVNTAIWEFARTHPMVSLSVHASDHQVDLVRDGFDLAIRLGVLADSSLKSRRIGAFRRVLVASPEALAGSPQMRTPADLAQAEFVTYAMLPGAFAMTNGAEDVTVTPERIRVEVSSIAAGKDAVMAGLGILNLPYSEVERELASGELVEVLSGWHLQTLGIYAVWPDSGAQKRLTRRLIDYIAA